MTQDVVALYQQSLAKRAASPAPGEPAAPVEKKPAVKAAKRAASAEAEKPASKAQAAKK